jgi:hypothetical protein
MSALMVAGETELKITKHVDSLLRHISYVQSACTLLGKRLIEQGQGSLGVDLVGRGMCHDNSKFHGIEWEYLHAGSDITPENMEMARRQHVMTNDHHPEFWNGVHNMSQIAVAEMVCDWYARSQEFGTGIREWVNSKATVKYNIDPTSEQHDWIEAFLSILLEDTFVKV